MNWTNFPLNSLIYVCNKRGSCEQSYKAAAWIKGLDVSSVQMLGSGCLCLHWSDLELLHECLRLWVDGWNREESQNAMRPWHCLFYCTVVQQKYN